MACDNNKHTLTQIIANKQYYCDYFETKLFPRVMIMYHNNASTHFQMHKNISEYIFIQYQEVLNTLNEIN